MGIEGGKEGEQALGGPVALTGSPVLKGLRKGRWLFQSVPVIDADSTAALRKGRN